jgi:nucleotide-binding universal stress UspA family protein
LATTGSAEAIREAIRLLYTEGLGVRIISEFGWILGTGPRRLRPAGVRRVLGSLPNSGARHAPCSVLIASTT